MEEKKSNVEDKMMPAKTCDVISEKVRKIVTMLLPMQKTQDKSTIDQLLDLERSIDKFLTYYKIITLAEEKRGFKDKKSAPTKKLLKDIK